MSAITNTLSNTVVEVNTKPLRVKKPTLVGKYSKFLVFGYGLVQSLQAQGLLTDEGVESAYGELKLLSSVEDQSQFYEGVLNQSKETGKLMRKYVTQRLAPPKAPRAKKDSVARKPRAKKEAGPEEAGEVKEKKKSVSRTKKATRVESDVSSDIVAELVDAANAEPVVNNDATEKKALKEAEKKAKQEAKEAEKKAKEQAKEAKQEAKEAEKKAKQEAKEAKKSAVAGKKVKTAAPPAPVVVVAEELQKEEGEDEEIHTQETDINGKTYLIDNENNLYSCVTHEELGKYDPETKSIVASA